MSSEMEEGFRIEMAEYIREEKELQVKLGVIEHNLEAPLAKLDKAKAILLKAKTHYEACLAEVQPLRSEQTLLQGELELVREKKSKLRREALLARGNPGQRPGTQALVEQMNELAGDPEEARTKDAVKALDTASALEALKQRMKE